MREVSGDKELLVSMIGAVLQDLRPPRGLADDPMPGKSASEADFLAWVDRHTKTCGSSKEPKAVIGDAIYDHYTARAILGGMPFCSRDRDYTLTQALQTLGIRDADRVIDLWRSDPEKAAQTGDRMVTAIHGRTSAQKVLEKESESDGDGEYAIACDLADIDNLTLPQETEEDPALELASTADSSLSHSSFWN